MRVVTTWRTSRNGMAKPSTTWLSSEARSRSYRRPVSLVWVGVDKHRRDRWVAKAPPSAEHQVLCKVGGPAEYHLDHYCSPRGAPSRRLRLYRNDFGR